MDNSFVVGDIVKLKSGGPEMTVKIVSEEHQIYTCQWFAGKKLEQGQFPGDSLVEVTTT
ncbi:YodC family protein [Paenalcaligenes sp. Me131]|uniref:YodC family protein n=1 Tax=Paenalcaligenes sp. Me131 TaxID=3392636 RepID=UPI003D2A035D